MSLSNNATSQNHTSQQLRSHSTDKQGQTFISKLDSKAA